MAAKPKKQTYEFYRAMLVGRRTKADDEFPGLRSYFDQFTPSNGYDLSNFANWTKTQRKKVREAFHDVSILRSQVHHVFRPRNKDHLRIAQEASHADIQPKGLKVAFVKYVKDKRNPEAPPVIEFRKNSMIVKNSYSQKQFIPFDKDLLFTDPNAEFKRIAEESGTRGIYTIQAGAYEITGRQHNFGSVQKRVKELMLQYDGRNTPSHHARNSSWNPKHHDSAQWLHGINAYQFAPGGTAQRLGSDQELQRAIAKKDRRAFQRKMRAIHKASKGDPIRK